MQRIRLIHWNADEAAERVEQLRAFGYEVIFSVPRTSAALRDVATDPPDAVVIDLHRMPAAGRDIGLYLRRQMPGSNDSHASRKWQTVDSMAQEGLWRGHGRLGTLCANERFG